MGCCQTSLLGPDFQSTPIGSINIQEKVPENKKLAFPIPISISNDNNIPQPTITPYFGKKFNFEDCDKTNHESKPLEIS